MPRGSEPRAGAVPGRRHMPGPRQPGEVRPRWEPTPPRGGRPTVSWLLPAGTNPLPGLMALVPWRQMGDEVLLLGVEPDPAATWAPLVDQAVPETGLAAGRLAWGDVVVHLPPGARWPDGLREMVLAGAEAANWGFCNRLPGPAWLSALGSLLVSVPGTRRLIASRLAGRALFWRADEAARVGEVGDLPGLGPPARLPVAVRTARS